MALSQSVYKIALFGPTNAGKTVYLTTLYSHGGNKDDSVSAHFVATDDKDDETHNYLTTAYQQLRDGQWPDATIFEKLNSIEFTVTSSGVQSKVQLPDVAGEVTGRGQKIENWTEFEHALKKEILAEFATYDGFLIFAPADDTVKGDSVSFKWEVDSLLLALKERASKDGVIRRPVAVVLSKWDVIASTLTGKEDEQLAAHEYFKRRYPETANGLAESCANWRVFPVSATGPIAGDRPPQELRPTGVAAPIVWLLRTADRSSLERANKYFQTNKHQLFAKHNPLKKELYIHQAIAKYEGIIAKRPGDETTREAHLGIAKLRQISRTLKRKRLAAWTGGISAAFLVIASAIDYMNYSSAQKSLVNAKQVAVELDPAIAQATDYVDSPFHVVGSLLGFKSTLSRLIAKREKEWEESWVKDLKNFAFVDATRAESLIVDCEKFRDRFEDSNFGQEIERISDGAKRFSDQQRGDTVAAQLIEQDADLLKISSKDVDQLEEWVLKAKAFLEAEGFENANRRNEVQTALATRRVLLAELSSEKDWASLKSRYAEKGESPFDQYLVVQQWLAQNGQAQLIHADEANQMRAKSLSSADSKAWRDLQEYKAKNSTNYQRHIEKVNEYLDRVEFTEHREDVKSFRQKVLVQWDEQLYQFVTEEIKGRELTGNQLVKIKERCKMYLDSKERPVAMRSNVEEWLAWYRQMETGITAEVELQSVKVNRGSHWHGVFYYPDVFVSVKANGKADRTNEKSLNLNADTSGFGKSKLGPFQWKLGDQDLSVSITCTDGYDETLTCDFRQDTFKLRHLNDTVSFDGGKITARLKCLAAVPPKLPPFEAVQ